MDACAAYVVVQFEKLRARNVSATAAGYSHVDVEIFGLPTVAGVVAICRQIIALREARKQLHSQQLFGPVGGVDVQGISASIICDIDAPANLPAPIANIILAPCRQC